MQCILWFGFLLILFINSAQNPVCHALTAAEQDVTNIEPEQMVLVWFKLFGAVGATGHKCWWMIPMVKSQSQDSPAHHSPPI
jgi:hypothetical protein